MEAVSIDGIEFQSEDFRVELHALSIHSSSIHHILLEKITITEPTKNAKDYFYIEFNQTLNMIYAELSGDFPLGDSRQPTYKSLRPFDLVS